MRIKTFTKGGYITGGFTSPGGTVTGKVILSGDPTEELQAATKGYTDSNLNNFNATSISTGTIQVGRLPAFTGDVTSSVGTNVLNLGTSGVSSGSYSKVTVNNKGLVTNGFGLSESDIPDLSWNKITSDKPTTLAGYGITDAFKVGGGALTGALTLHADPTSSLHAATKQYADSKISISGGVKVGDIIKKTTSVTPAGFLKCNGGEVAKADYSALYAVVGDVNSIDLQPGSGKPWRQQYVINTEQSGDITGWTTGTALPEVLGNSQAVVTKNRVYLLGGYSGGSHVSTVYTAPINSDGTLGGWTTGTALPGGLFGSQAVVTKNRVYLLGGYSSSGLVSTVYTATINSDGTLGSWTTGTDLPEALSYSQAVVTKNRVYLLGGLDGSGSHVSTVYTAPINGDGTLGSWTTGTSLPGPLAESQAVVTKNRVYLLGGFIGSVGYVSTVYTAPINSDGSLGSWTTGTSLPGALGRSQAVVTKNRVYLLGGLDGSSIVSTVYTAPINSDGTLGSWTEGTALPVALAESQAVVTKNRVYLLGGYDGSDNSYVSTVYTASILGGLNDYSPYYDGSLTPTDPTKFRLPDLTAQALEVSYYYIKA